MSKTWYYENLKNWLFWKLKIIILNLSNIWIRRSFIGVKNGAGNFFNSSFACELSFHISWLSLAGIFINQKCQSFISISCWTTCWKLLKKILTVILIVQFQEKLSILRKISSIRCTYMNTWTTLEGVHLSTSRKLHISFDLSNRELARTDASDTFFSSRALD